MYIGCSRSHLLAAEVLIRDLEDLAIELRQRAGASACSPRSRSAFFVAELLGRVEVEQVDVVRRDVLIPDAGAAARDRRSCARRRTAGRSSPSSGTESSTAARSRPRSATGRRRCAVGLAAMRCRIFGIAVHLLRRHGRRSSSAAARAARCSAARTSWPAPSGRSRRGSRRSASGRSCRPSAAAAAVRASASAARRSAPTFITDADRDRAAPARGAEPRPATLGRRLRHARQLFDGVGQDRRRRHVEPRRPHERPRRSSRSRRSSSSVRSSAVVRSRTCSSSVAGHVQQAAVLVQQVVEVQRAFLRAGVLRARAPRRPDGRRCPPRSARWC